MQQEHQELLRSKAELMMLYEISNAMRTTLKLDQILFIILTGVTSHEGLGFNRAMLFLTYQEGKILEGKMGLGPDTAEEADKIWKHIEREKMTLEDLIDEYDKWKDNPSRLDDIVNSIKIPLRENAGVLAMTALEGMSFEITTHEARLRAKDSIIDQLKAEYFVTVPLMAKNKVIGVIMADNIVTKKPITKDDVRVLTMFANQAGLAIENSILYEQTLTMSQMDSQTGLWNHGYFHDIMTEKLAEAAEHKKYLSLLMMDIDNFKHYNDAVGHQAGDGVIKELAKILKQNSRADDIVCRYGGEEFSVVLLDTDKEQAVKQAERLRQAIYNFDFPKKEIQPSKYISVSIGVSCYPFDAKGKDELIYKADANLYEAKRAGKNRIFAG